MKIEESVVNLLSKSSKVYFIRLFDSFPSKERIREILKVRTGSTWRKNASLGVLDDTEAQLVFIKIYIIDFISKSENWSEIDRKIYNKTYSHGRRAEREFKETQQKSSDYRDELREDLEKVSGQLTEKIELKFKDSLPSFLEANGFLKEKVHWYNGQILIPGYDFCFYGDTIFVEDIYPMGGD